MTIEQIEQKNLQFQNNALGLTELVPGANVLEFSTFLKRNAGGIHKLFVRLIESKNETALWKALEKMEELMDDLVYDLDRLHDINCVIKAPVVEKFIKSGYDLLSVYSLSSNQVVNQKMDKKVIE